MMYDAEFESLMRQYRASSSSSASSPFPPPSPPPSPCLFDQSSGEGEGASAGSGRTVPGSAAPRKRCVNNGAPRYPESTNIEVPLPDLDFNDPNFLELLKEYDNDSDSSEERERELAALRAQANLKPLISQGAAYFAVIALVGLFVLVINWYNTKQLERLKEEFGFNEKNASPELWWRSAVIYHIYVRSYQDSTADGIGDLNGIRRRLDHLVYLGVDAVLLSCFYESPFEDFGRDVSDFKMVHSEFGSLVEFDKLVHELHERGIKVVIELIPNHTNKKHPWFQQSRRGGKTGYEDYYIWHGGIALPNGTKLPPNNWVSRFGGSAWTYDENRQKFYYHYYHESMPDLNHRNPSVRKEFIEIFRFWLDRGVDALSIGSSHVIYESDDLELDEPLVEQMEIQPGDYRSLTHIYTEHQPDLHDFLGTWREFIEAYSLKSGRKIGLLLDVASDSPIDVIKYYFTGADAPFCYALMNIHTSCGGRCIHEMIDDWMTRLPEEHETIWMLSHPDLKRGASPRGPVYQSLLNILVMLLPGGVVSFYGDEIGMQDVRLDSLASGKHHAGQTVQPDRNFAGSRSPMQWSSGQNLGFSDAVLWIPEDPLANVEAQMNDERGTSPVQIYHRLTRLRRERSFTVGQVQYAVVNDNIMSFMRYSKDSAPYLIALNLGDSESTDDYTLSAGVSQGKIVLSVTERGSSLSTVREGSLVNLARLTLKPGEGAVMVLMFNVDFDH